MATASNQDHFQPHNISLLLIMSTKLQIDEADLSHS